MVQSAIVPDECDSGQVTVSSPTSHSVHWRDRKVEFLPGLPYDEWRELDVDLSIGEYRALQVDEEQLLFRQMNLAYWHAASVQEAARDPQADDRAEQEFAYWVHRAEAIRDKIVRSFYKLSYSVAARYTNRLYTFDELASEGHFTLLKAIARFDPERGFRFSTYAMYAIQRRLFRFMQQRSRQRKFAESNSDDVAEADSRRWTIEYERRMTTATVALERLLPQLSPRERYVIRSRYGWGQEFEPRTLQDIADELNVSRERIRQLETRAIRKLRALAEPLDVQVA
jgi:RNA polymerase primary sigma factor